MLRAVISMPIGSLPVAIDDDGILRELWLPNRRSNLRASAGSPAAQAALKALTLQLTEYFEGRRRSFEIPLQPNGSDFERMVWERLRRIKYGETISYGLLARELGLQNGARAVGRANGANPIPIIIPCHRVIGSSGSLVGFGGGLPLKQFLLELEGAVDPPPPRLL